MATQGHKGEEATIGEIIEEITVVITEGAIIIEGAKIKKIIEIQNKVGCLVQRQYVVGIANQTNICTTHAPKYLSLIFPYVEIVVKVMTGDLLPVIQNPRRRRKNLKNVSLLIVVLEFLLTRLTLF